MTAQQELLKERQSLQEVKISKMLVEEILGANYNAEVLISCVLEKLEHLEREIKRVNSNMLTDHLIKDTRQLVFIIEQERDNNFKRIDNLLTQIENS